MHEKYLVDGNNEIYGFRNEIEIMTVITEIEQMK